MFVIDQSPNVAGVDFSMEINAKCYDTCFLDQKAPSKFGVIWR